LPCCVAWVIENAVTSAAMTSALTLEFRLALTGRMASVSLRTEHNTFLYSRFTLQVVSATIPRRAGLPHFPRSIETLVHAR